MTPVTVDGHSKYAGHGVGSMPKPPGRYALDKTYAHTVYMLAGHDLLLDLLSTGPASNHSGGDILEMFLT